MANGFATGVSSTPLDIASAGQIFMRSAVETRLAEIEANKLEVSENVKKALKAMSISTIEGLSQNMRVRYQKEIEKYRDDVRNKLISNQGKLSLDDEREIQDGFVDLQKRQAADVFQLKQLAKAQDMIVANYDSYDPRVVDELRQAEEALDRGEFIGDPLAMVVKNRVPSSVGDIVSKFYGNELTMLGRSVKGQFTGNIFSQTELTGLDPDTRVLTEKAVNLRDRLLEDPRIKYRYTNPDGSLNPEAYAREKQAVEDNITQILEEMKPYRQTTGRTGSQYDAFVSYEPDVEQIETDEQPISARYGANIPFTGITSFTWDGVRVVPEGAQFMIVAKDKDKYNKVMDKVRANAQDIEMRGGKVPPKSDHLIVDESIVDRFDPSELEYRPFAKLVFPKEKGIFFRTIDDLAGRDTEVKFVPFEGRAKAAIVGKMGTKREGYLNAIDEAGSTLKQDVSRPATSVPELTRSELINMGYSNRQIDEAVKEGKIKLR